MTLQSKGRAKDINREARSTETILLKRNMPERHAKVLRFNCKRGKYGGKKSDKEKVTIAIANIANHRPKDTSGKLL